MLILGREALSCMPMSVLMSRVISVEIRCQINVELWTHI